MSLRHLVICSLVRPAAADPPKDDRDKYGAGRFDPSAGDQAQKTPKHPVGDALVPMPSKAAYELLVAGRQAKRFFDNELALKRDMIAKIEASNKQRWN